VICSNPRCLRVVSSRGFPQHRWKSACQAFPPFHLSLADPASPPCRPDAPSSSPSLDELPPPAPATAPPPAPPASAASPAPLASDPASPGAPAAHPSAPSDPTHPELPVCLRQILSDITSAGRLHRTIPPDSRDAWRSIVILALKRCVILAATTSPVPPDNTAEHTAARRSICLHCRLVSYNSTATGMAARTVATCDFASAPPLLARPVTPTPRSPRRARRARRPS
jgi:hypothetical protein